MPQFDLWCGEKLDEYGSPWAPTPTVKWTIASRKMPRKRPGLHVSKDKFQPKWSRQQIHATSDEVYKQIDNALYDEQGNTWWDENQCLHLLKSSVNPARVGYIRRLLDQVLKIDYRGAAVSMIEEKHTRPVGPVTTLVVAASFLLSRSPRLIRRPSWRSALGPIFRSFPS